MTDLKAGPFFRRLRIKKLKHFVAPLWTKASTADGIESYGSHQEMNKMHIQTSGRLRWTHLIFRGCVHIHGDTTLEVNTKTMLHSFSYF